MSRVPSPLCASLVLTLALATGTLSARSINWGSRLLGTLYDSQGAALDDTFTFEIGSFGSFIPTSSNLNLWAANWHVFDRAQAPAINGWNSALGFITSGANLTTAGTSSESPPLPAWAFPQGEQGYFWAFNTPTYGAGAEWALITNNASDGSSSNDWLFPAWTDQASQPLDWRLSVASSVIFGGLNSSEGPGAFSNTPASFDLQTHQVVPEPATGLLVIFSALAFRTRKRRS